MQITIFVCVESLTGGSAFSLREKRRRSESQATRKKFFQTGKPMPPITESAMMPPRKTVQSGTPGVASPFGSVEKPALQNAMTEWNTEKKIGSATVPCANEK